MGQFYGISIILLFYLALFCTLLRGLRYEGEQREY